MKRFLMYGISKSLLIKIILFLLILLLGKNVFAMEIDVSSSITSPNSSGNGKYLGTEILNTGSQSTYNINTRYQGKLSRIIFNLPLPSEFGDCFTTNATYTVTMYMATNDWNNAFGSVKVRPYSSSSTNWSNGNVTYVSYKKIYFTFKIPSSDTTCYDFVWVDLPSSNLTSTGITQISNWNLSKVTLTDPTISNGGSGSGTSPTPSPDSSQAIINNQNQNTNNIINNQNENTQNIIENNNENTEKIIDSLSDCYTNIFNPSAYTSSNFNDTQATSTGINATASQTWKTISYTFNVEVGEEYVLHYKSSTTGAIMYRSSGNNWVQINNGSYFSFRPDSETIEVRLQNSSLGTGIYNWDELMLVKNGGATFIPFGKPQCNNKIDATTDAINNLNDTMTDETAPDIDLDLDLDTNSPVSDLLTMPLTILNKIYDITDDSCQPYVLPFDFFGGNNTLTLPCINLQDRLGNNVYNILDTLLCFFIAYQIGMMCITIYEDITTLRDGFGGLYQPKHGPDSYTPRHGGGE